MPDGRDRVGYAFNIAYIESKGIVSEMQEGIGITNVYNAIWVRRRKSGSFLTSAPPPVDFGFGDGNQEPECVINRSRIPERLRNISIEPHYIGTLTISFVILTANCARKVILRKHVVVRAILTFLTHTFFSRGG